MRKLVAKRSENDFGVTRDFNLADTVAVVAERDAPNLNVILGRNCDVQLRRDFFITAPERRLFRQEGRQVLLGLNPYRMVGRAPHRPTANVAQVGELAAWV